MDGRPGRNRFLGKAERGTSSTAGLLGDVPLIAAATVAVSRKKDGQSVSQAVGEKGYLPLNTLNKMNRKRAEKEERRALLPMSSVAQWHPHRTRSFPVPRNLLSIPGMHNALAADEQNGAERGIVCRRLPSSTSFLQDF